MGNSDSTLVEHLTSEQRERLDDLIDTKDRLLSENKNLIGQLANLQSSKESIQNSSSRLDRELNEERNKNRTLIAKCSALEKELEGVKKLKGDLNSKSVALETDIKTKQSANEQLKGRLSELDQRLKSEQDTSQQGAVANATLGERSHHLELKLKDLTSELDAKKSELSKLETNYALLTAQLTSSKQKVIKLSGDIKSLKSTNLQQKENLEKSRTQETDIRASLELAKQKVSSLETELKGLTVTAQESDKKVAEMQATKEEQMKQLANAYQQTTTLVSNNASENRGLIVAFADRLAVQQDKHSAQQENTMTRFMGMMGSMMHANHNVPQQQQPYQPVQYYPPMAIQAPYGHQPGVQPNYQPYMGHPPTLNNQAGPQTAPHGHQPGVQPNYQPYMGHPPTLNNQAGPQTGNLQYGYAQGQPPAHQQTVPPRAPWPQQPAPHMVPPGCTSPHAANLDHGMPSEPTSSSAPRFSSDPGSSELVHPAQHAQQDTDKSGQ